MFIITALTAQATVLWSGERTYSNGRALPTPDDRVVIPATMFGGAMVGDRLVFEFTNYPDDPILKPHVIRLLVPGTFATLDTEFYVSEGDRKASVMIDETLLEKLQKTGVALSGTGYTVSSVTIERADEYLWEGFKVVTGEGYTVGILKPEWFRNVKAGNILMIEAESTADAAKCVLLEKSTWKALASNTEDGHIFTDFNTEGPTFFSFEINDDALRSLQTNGMYASGTNYNLLSVAVASATGIGNDIQKTSQAPTAYDINGVKLPDGFNYTDLPKGIYVINGKKVVRP